ALGRRDELDQVIRQLEAPPQGRVAVAQLRAADHTSRGDLPSARQILEQALAAAPRTPEPLLPVRPGLLREGRGWTAAEKVLRDLLALNPNHYEARNNLAVLLRQQGRPTDLPPAAGAGEPIPKEAKAPEPGRDAGQLYTREFQVQTHLQAHRS